jgi:hypothetical protein
MGALAAASGVVLSKVTHDWLLAGLKAKRREKWEAARRVHTGDEDDTEKSKFIPEEPKSIPTRMIEASMERITFSHDAAKGFVKAVKGALSTGGSSFGGSSVRHPSNRAPSTQT